MQQTAFRRKYLLVLLNVLQVISVVTSGGRPPVDGIDDVPRHMKELMKSCWDHNPHNRPNFKSVSFFIY